MLPPWRECGSVVRNVTGHVKYGSSPSATPLSRGMTPSMAPIYDTDLSAGRYP